PLFSFLSSRYTSAASTEISTLSLHDALPICSACSRCALSSQQAANSSSRRCCAPLRRCLNGAMPSRSWLSLSSSSSSRHCICWRSEEHTSELQSRENLVCRLLLEKKNKQSKN